MTVIVVGRAQGKSAVAKYAEERNERERQLLALIEMFERGQPYVEEVKEPPEEQPEDKKTGFVVSCPCSRQLPGGHRIPWYTSGFQ